MSKATITPEVVRERLEAAFYTLDIPSEVERHTGTRLHLVSRTGKQYGGACPFPDCLVDTDGFSVWPVLTPRGRHYYCRGCRRSGDIVKLVQDIKGLGFSDACKALGVQNPYLDGDSSVILPCSQMRKPTPKAERWQLDELAYLTSVYQRAKSALQRDRARAYLAERAIPFDLAMEQGLGYIPALSEVSHMTPQIERFGRWCDRIIFPILTPKGEIGYCGRSLFLWEPGMDEDEHKRRIDTYNLQMKEQHGDKATWHQMPRWKYTYQQGFFNWQVVKEFDTVIFVEGAFDALACMASGMLNVIPIGTTGLDAGMLPINVCNAVMGLDIDGPGRKAAKQLATSLRRKGIDVSVCRPPEGAKDWSAAYRLYGVQGLASLFNAVEEVPSEVPSAEVETPIADSVSFQQEHCSQPKAYKPVSLSPLPRTQCPIREIVWDKTGRQVKHYCKRRPTENGFCKEHQMAHEFLQIGAQLGYPEIKIPFTAHISGCIQQLHRTIHEGVSRWEDHACVSSRLQESINHLQHDARETVNK